MISRWRKDPDLGPPIGWVERALRPVLRVGERRVSTFQVCGTIGFACAGATALALGARLGLSLLVFALLIPAAAGVLFALAWLTLQILGSERLVYYHHELAVLGTSALLLTALGRPLLPYLDVSVLSLAVFLVFGRLGCSAVGCCYGRPHRLGWRYREEHADVGFARWLVGVRLFPVQLVESWCVLTLTALAAWRLVAGARPGETLATQLVVYGLLRFVLELARGDAERPTWHGFSEAQWTSLGLALAVLGAERAQWLPRVGWHAAIVVALVTAFVLVAFRRLAQSSSHRFLAADHVHEVAQAVLGDGHTSQTVAQAVQIHTTSLGVKLSSCTVAAGTVRARVYTLSGIDRASARPIADLILRLRWPVGPSSLIERRPGLFQLVVPIAQSDEDGVVR